MFLDSLEARLDYQTGTIKFDSLGEINVPQGFRYLDTNQTEYVLTELWGNPDGSGTLGMLVPENISVMADNSWAFIITYDAMGYVKDDDADDIDYEELLQEMKKDTEEANQEREKLGYTKVDLVGWASEPYYDAEKKTLHWAKELRFAENETSTLNYNVRMLGRKGVLVMNAVSTMNELPLVKENIAKVQASFQFADGMKYENFDPELDEVAAWTIGGLVAGKMLAKAGILALLLKYIKLIGLGLLAVGGAIWKWFKGRKAENPYASTAPPPAENS
jgi:uncharacterized membrane-anchored protein